MRNELPMLDGALRPDSLQMWCVDSYAQAMASAADFVAEPPALPPQTRLTPLDLPMEVERQEPALSDGNPRPSVPVDHAVMEHLFVCADGGSLAEKHSALLLASCTRYRGKHTIMTLLYKPLRRERGGELGLHVA